MASSSLIDTLASLVRINSINPSYEGGPGEREIATWVREYFEQRGIEVWEQEVFPNRPNVIARLPGKNPNRRIILEAHTDTVSVKGMTIPPFEPRIEDGKMYGRGSCDTKAGLAGMMHALATLHEEGIQPPCEVWLAAAVDEEFSYRGVVKLCEGLTGHAALVAEPTGLRAVIATKGVLRFRILVRGKSAHSSKPHLGVNAINHMARIVLALEQDHLRLAVNDHPLLGPATCNVGVIQGGVQINFVPDACAIEIDRRLLPGERTVDVLAHYQRILDQLKSEHPTMDAGIEDPPLLTDEALETSADSDAAQCASAVLRDMGLNAELCGVPFGCDASKLSRQGVPSLVFGPGSIDRAHAAVEYVELDQVQQAFEFYRNFILRFQ
ncbi:M20 family metallopeptidase [Roseimicrobium sp. ORNL1]|uniref:M20 family metallopeptidase n=1 Tax=Roseimicrobium sp. ORNL1 TaxID=2711231 RepID=UPI0013E1B3DD|nr:M20 family metallopeptidase [Roseimicrobium sp. ORNL1]QIF05025.1 M20 family metallopeptidase [Roseimicrobium sp. ORNL1]